MNHMKLFLQEHRRSQADVANALGISQQAVGKWVAQGYAPLDRALEIQRIFSFPALRLIKNADIAKAKRLLGMDQDDLAY